MYNMLKTQKMSQILVPGSHDAGIMSSTAKPDYYVTQTHSIAQQMCRGFRFFDIRIKKHSDGNFKMLHPGKGPFADGWAGGWTETWADIKLFLDDPLHKHEVTYLRFKPAGMKKPDQIAFMNQLAGQITPYAYKSPGKIAELTFGTVSPADSTKGRVIFLAYDFEKANKFTGAGQTLMTDKAWDYKENFGGKFSQTHKMTYVLTHTCGLVSCGSSSSDTGQYGMLKKWKEGAERNTKMHVFYFTFTFGKIREQLKHKTVEKYQNALNDLTVAAYANFETLGNVFMVDFCGDTEIWSDQKFNNSAGITSANGRSVASLVKYINTQKFSNKNVVAKTTADTEGLKMIATGTAKCQALNALTCMDSDPAKTGLQPGQAKTDDVQGTPKEQEVITASPPLDSED
jgi:hypothetical protein